MHGMEAAFWVHCLTFACGCSEAFIVRKIAVHHALMASGCWNIPSLFQMLKLSGMSTPMGQGMQ